MMDIPGSTHQMEAAPKKPTRLVEIDLIVGFAIALVVLGHFADRSSQGIDWYVSLKIYIYKFHMPLFMFASGSVAFHVAGKLESFRDYLGYCKKKLWRLGSPFLMFGFTIVFLKWLIKVSLADQFWMPQLSDDLFVLFFYTSDSEAGFLWYLVVLFELLVVIPILLVFLGHRSLLLLTFFAVLNCTRIFLEYSNFLMFDFLVQLSFFFALGQVYSQYRTRILSFLEASSNYWAIFPAVFLLSFLTIEHVDDDVSKLIIGTMSIPAFLRIALTLKSELLIKALCWLSEFSLTIYLMNSITIGVLRGGVSYFLGWSPDVFFLMTPIFFFAGIFVPVLAYRYVFLKIGLGRFVK